MIPDILLAKPMYRKHTNQNCLFTFIGLWFIVLDLGVIVFHMFSSHCLSSRLHNCLLISTVSTVIRIIFISFFFTLFLLYLLCLSHDFHISNVQFPHPVQLPSSLECITFPITYLFWPCP